MKQNNKDIIKEKCPQCKKIFAIFDIEKKIYCCKNCGLKTPLKTKKIKIFIPKPENMTMEEMEIYMKEIQKINKIYENLNDNPEEINIFVQNFLKEAKENVEVIDLDKKNKYRLSGADFEVRFGNKKIYYELVRLKNKDMNNDNVLAQIQKRISVKYKKYKKAYQNFEINENNLKNYQKNKITKELFKNINLLIFECVNINEINYSKNLYKNPFLKIMDSRHLDINDIKKEITSFIIKNKYYDVFSLVCLLTNRSMEIKTYDDLTKPKFKAGNLFSRK